MSEERQQAAAIETGVEQLLDALYALRRLGPRPTLGPPRGYEDPRLLPLGLLAEAVHDRLQTLMGEPFYGDTDRRIMLADDASTSARRIDEIVTALHRMTPTDVRHVRDMLKRQYPAAFNTDLW